MNVLVVSLDSIQINMLPRIQIQQLTHFPYLYA